MGYRNTYQGRRAIGNLLWLLRLAALYVITVLLVTLVFALVRLEFNPLEWPTEARAFCAFIALPITGFLCVLLMRPPE